MPDSVVGTGWVRSLDPCDIEGDEAFRSVVVATLQVVEEVTLKVEGLDCLYPPSFCLVGWKLN